MNIRICLGFEAVLLFFLTSVLILLSPEVIIFRSVHIQGVSGGIVNILGGGNMDYSE